MRFLILGQKSNHKVLGEFIFGILRFTAAISEKLGFNTIILSNFPPYCYFDFLVVKMRYFNFRPKNL